MRVGRSWLCANIRYSNKRGLRYNSISALLMTVRNIDLKNR